MKRTLRWILIALAVYLALLALLLAAESGSPESGIRSFGDALWYSLITMTTVGYGDLAPVTPMGRFLGILFALASVGILTALIGLGLRLVGRAIIPRRRLRLGRKRTWYAFTEECDEAAALGRALRRREPGCLLIFPEGEGKSVDGLGVVRLKFDEELLRHLRGTAEGLSLFFMGPEPWDNYSRALACAQRGIDAYCMADITAEHLPPQLQLFSPNEVTSRFYWKNHPLTRDEGCVVLIGGGAVSTALLERALLTNVFETGRRVSYHVFGGGREFAALHPEIMKALTGADGGDSLTFHSESWFETHELLRTADRILICCDSEAENHFVCERLNRWFVTGAKVHVRLREPIPGVESFGSLEECYTPEFVMKDEVNRRAVLMNDIYNEGAAHPVAWRDLSAFLQQSNIAAADHLIVKARFLLEDETLTELSDEDCRRAYERFAERWKTEPDLLQEMEHRRWMRFHQMYNWQYAPVRDNARRLHPMLVPYEQLSAENRRKDAYAWEMLGRLGRR